MAVETVIRWNRVLDDHEVIAINRYVNRKLETSPTDGVLTLSGPENEWQVIRSWDTIDSANTFIELINAFTPPPISIEVKS